MAAVAVQGQLEQAWVGAGLGMVGPLERMQLGYTSAGLLDCKVDLRKDPLALAENRTTRDGPCNLAGQQAAA